MSALKLTPWFPGSVKPVRPGVYERRTWRTLIYSQWTGGVWMGASESPDEAILADWICAVQSDDWRGLAEEPK